MSVVMVSVLVGIRQIRRFMLLMGCAALVVASPVVSQEQAEGDQGLITIESDLQSADNITGVVTASGNVRLKHVDRGVVATSRQAQYFTKESRIVLSGDVDVIQDDGNLLQADRVIYLLDEERAVAEPLEGEQVYSRFVLNQVESDQQPLLP